MKNRSGALSPLPALDLPAAPKSALQPIRTTPPVATEPKLIGEFILLHRVDPLHERRVIRQVAHLLELAYMALDQNKFERCTSLCYRILKIDPDYPVPWELMTLAAAKQSGIGASTVERFKRQTDDDDSPRIPAQFDLVIPSPDRWPEVSRDGLESPIKDDPESPPAIRRKLETMKVDLSFENTRVEDIFAFIRDFSGLNIILDAECRGWVDPDLLLTFHLKDAVLKDILRQLLSRLSLDYAVTEEDVVLLTFPYKVAAFRRQN